MLFAAAHGHSRDHPAGVGEADPEDAAWKELAVAVCELGGELRLSDAIHDMLAISWRDNSTNEDGFKIYKWGWDGATWEFRYSEIHHQFPPKGGWPIGLASDAPWHGTCFNSARKQNDRGGHFQRQYSR